MITRSKARQIFQSNLPQAPKNRSNAGQIFETGLPESPKNRLNNVINRILSVNTNTSANLRNLRRIRRS